MLTLNTLERQSNVSPSSVFQHVSANDIVADKVLKGILKVALLSIGNFATAVCVHGLYCYSTFIFRHSVCGYASDRNSPQIDVVLLINYIQ